MTMQNPKIERSVQTDARRGEIHRNEFKKEQFKEEFKNGSKLTIKRIKQFILNLIQFVDSLSFDRTCKIIADQLIRSGTSVGANYFEARAASSKSDFTNFFNHCLKSALRQAQGGERSRTTNESKFWLELLIDAKKCNTQEANKLLKEVSEIASIFASSILTLPDGSP